MTDPNLPLFSQAAYDQYAAAVKNNDWPVAAQIAVDGYLRILEMDVGDADVTIEQIIPAMMLLSNSSLVLWAAEALRRLHKRERIVVTDFDFDGLQAEMVADHANALLDRQIERGRKWIRLQEAKGETPTLHDFIKKCLSESSKRRHIVTAYATALWRFIHED